MPYPIHVQCVSYASGSAAPGWTTFSGDVPTPPMCLSPREALLRVAESRAFSPHLESGQHYAVTFNDGRQIVYEVEATEPLRLNRVSVTPPAPAPRSHQPRSPVLALLAERDEARTALAATEKRIDELLAFQRAEDDELFAAQLSVEKLTAEVERLTRERDALAAHNGTQARAINLLRDQIRQASSILSS